MLPAQRSHCGTHRRSGRQTVIDEYHGVALHKRRSVIATINVLASFQFLFFPSRNSIDHFFRQAEAADYVVVQYANVAGRDGTHRQLFLTGNAELANDEDVEGRIERSRHLERHRHATTGQREHKDIGSIGVMLQPAGQCCTRLASIHE